MLPLSLARLVLLLSCEDISSAIVARFLELFAAAHRYILLADVFCGEHATFDPNYFYIIKYGVYHVKPRGVA